jgi:hypothetical protein
MLDAAWRPPAESLRRLPTKEILAAARPTLDEHVEQGIPLTSF